MKRIFERTIEIFKDDIEDIKKAYDELVEGDSIPILIVGSAWLLLIMAVICFFIVLIFLLFNSL